VDNIYEFAIRYPRPGRFDGDELILAKGYDDAQRIVRERFGVWPTRVNLLGAVPDIDGMRVTLTGLGWLVATEQS
jgi:hypothetical protein